MKQRDLRQIASAIATLQKTSDTLDQVALARQAREAAERIELSCVEQARDDGYTWTEVGAVYGLTKQGAQQRFANMTSGGTRRRKH